MKHIQYINYETAEAARRMLNIHGPQVQRTTVTNDCKILISWTDGTASYVTWSLFNVLTES